MMNNQNKKHAPWPLIAFGMIGASISGVTFISVPGNVMNQNFYYIPLVLGFCVGYIVIANLLLPLYYRQGLSSIYQFIGARYGEVSHKTASAVFMVSRMLAVGVKIFAAILVIRTFISGHTSMSGTLQTALITSAMMAFIYLYSRKGVRALIWTDVVQTLFMLGAVVLTVVFICRNCGMGVAAVCSEASQMRMPGYDCTVTSMFNLDPNAGNNALKQFISGIFVTIAMTGTDQSMMQKNLACKDLSSGRKNMYAIALNILLVNLFFLTFGMILCWYLARNGGMQAYGITRTDEIFPAIARSLGPVVSVSFLVGLLCATLPGTGNALNALTTSLCVDFLGTERRRPLVMSLFALLFVGLVVLLQVLSSDALINLIYTFVSYTYGPLLGIFFFGVFSHRKPCDKATPFIAVASPLLCLALNSALKHFMGFDLGFTLLILNASLTYCAIWALSRKNLVSLQG